MKIAVLEWSCGGGLLTTAAGKASESLCREGWLMLSNLADGLAEAGCDVLMPVDLRGVPWAAARGRAHIIDVPCRMPTTFEKLLSRWAYIASECDYVWVIAPEIDGLLPHILERLRSEGQQLLNCQGEFLRNCSNKLLTADALTAAGVPHPATTVLAEFDEAWLVATASRREPGDQHQANARWVIKPASGAGGTDQRLVTRKQLRQLSYSTADAWYSTKNYCGSRDSYAWLVQPWLPGRSASCTAIVDARGKRHWLPLVSQDFRAPQSLDEGTHSFMQASDSAAFAPQYVGCTYPCAELPSAAPRAMLEAALDALGRGAYGPVGVDLLFNSTTQTWTVIEVNARCTSSLTAMAAAYHGNLVGDIFRLLTESGEAAVAELPERVSPFQFRVASA